MTQEVGTKVYERIHFTETKTTFLIKDGTVRYICYCAGVTDGRFVSAMRYHYVGCRVLQSYRHNCQITSLYLIADYTFNARKLVPCQSQLGDLQDAGDRYGLDIYRINSD